MKNPVDGKFIRSLTALALPIAAQSFLLSSVNFIDNFMIGRLGEVNIAAVALGNQVYFLVMLLLFGITSGTGIFVSQYWGKRDTAMVRRIEGIALSISLGSCLTIAAIAVSIPQPILGLLTGDGPVVELGASYLRIVAFSYPLTAVTFTFAMVLRSSGFTKVPFTAAAAALTINVVLNATLIFGLLGFPAMGVRGAAWGTLVARGIEACIIVGLSYRRRLPAAASFRALTDWNRRLLQRVMKTAAPVIFNEFGWVTGIIMINVVFARISTEAIAARNIADTIFRLLLVLMIGMGNGAHIMIGNAIGSEREDDARLLAVQFSVLAPVTALATGSVLLLSAPWVPLLFNVGNLTARYITQFLLVIAFVFPFKALSMIQIVGIFRGGGDTRFSMALDVGGVWLIGLPLALVSGLVLNLPVWIVFFLASSEEIIKSFIGIARTASGKWLNNLTDETPGIPLEKAPK